MTAKYYALLTNLGAAKLANATALGTQLSLTQMAVGDGGGTLPTPDPAQTALKGEKRRAALNSLSVDAANPNQIIAEQIIPEDEGGFWIREIGLYDDSGVLIAVANCPETYKPLLQEGSGRTQTVRMILVVNSTDAVTLKIDPSVVLATREYVDNRIIEVKAYVDDQLNKHIAAENPHTQYLRINQSLSEIKALGPQAVDAVLANLGLTEHLIPVGVPLPWPGAVPPAGWLSCDGAAFDKAHFPQLAQAYPSGKLPDLRGEFIRGWDNGRGVDHGRAVLSWQADAFQGHKRDLKRVSGASNAILHGVINFASGATPNVGTASAEGQGDSWITANYMAEGSYGIPRVAAETRPRNISFNYIVRAA
ncbi:phage tail protein [Chimaeribacter arupi]|uniref:phage tail protein n=1 Tax=Chimaeribacter arupi TaxID=2060066 RepID=UPI002945185D|nr:phage tail protein [Chimaeribacter arupi]MDV5142733.1 phage tail protein [Chimaeribacter arupi]